MGVDAGVQCDGDYLLDGPQALQHVPHLAPSSSQKSLQSDASTLSSFEACLPQEATDFHVQVNPRKIRSARVPSHHRSSPQRGYDFTVQPQMAAVQRTRQSTLLQPVAELEKLVDVRHAADIRSEFFDERITFRKERVNRYRTQRQFPALVSPRFLPSFNVVRDALEGYHEVTHKRDESNRKQEEELPIEPQFRVSKLMTPTVSKVRKYRRKRHPLELLPFLSSASSDKDKMLDRRPGLYDDSYDAAEQAWRDECYTSKSRFVHGAFKPSSAKPVRVLAPLPNRRAQTATIAARQPGTANSARNVPGPGASESGFQTPPSTGLSSQAVRELENTGVTSTASTATTFKEDRRSSRGSRGGSLVGRASRTTLHGRASIFQKRRNSVDLHKMSLTEKEAEKKHPKKPTEMSIPIFEKPAVDSLASVSVTHKRKEEEKETTDRLSVQVFKKYADEGKLHQDDCSKALEAMGFVVPDKSWILDAFQSISSQYVTIGYDDWLRFVHCYEAKQRSHYRQCFEKCDADGSGTVDVSELTGLVAELGIEPMKHVLDEIIAEVDADNTGTVDFDEFEDVMTILRRREGFTKEEYEEINGLFERFDRDNSGSMNTKEVEIALHWLGFHFSSESLRNILKEIDEDQSGLIDCQEWFRCMRKVREQKIQNLLEIVQANDKDGDGTLNQSELQYLLRSVGYVPDLDAVKESAEDAGIDPDDNDLDISELWRLLAIYRGREGLSHADLEQIESAFKRNNLSIDSEIDIVDIGKIIRSIGYTLSFEMQQNLTNKVDIDCSGKLDNREFRKMIRMMHQQDIDMCKMAFEEAVGIDPKPRNKPRTPQTIASATSAHCTFKFAARNDGMVITINQAIHGLKRVGCTDTHKRCEELLEKEITEDDQVDFYAFSQAAMKSRQRQREKFRENGGFTTEEVAELQISFNRYDSDSSGQISGQETVRLMEEEFPMLTKDPARRPQMIQLLNEADEDGSGSLDFGDFLRIMRHLRDINDQLRIGKELEAVSTTKFTPPEVQEFRELFLATGGGNKELGFDEVKELLKCIVPMGSKNVEELKVKFFEFSAQQMGVLGGSDLLDFPEFLWLMRELVDMNFAGMNDTANAMVAK